MPTYNRDRDPQAEITKSPWPIAPLNLFMLEGSTRGIIDLRWDDPSYLSVNSRFQVLGVNVYRSFDSEFGPYRRITDLPVGSTFWRDQTDNELIVDEDVSEQFLLSGPASVAYDGERYVFKTQNSPIVGEGSRGVETDLTNQVKVYIDGRQATLRSVNGATGEVEIDPQGYPEVGTQTYADRVVPVAGSKVTCTYRYTRDFLRTDLGQRIFYRITTVGLPADSTWHGATAHDLAETPLEFAVATNTFEIEKLDYIWRESVRRNRWILEQGGERVSVFLRKNNGIPCPCVSQTDKQPISDCRYCFGVGFLGGYEGPYPIIVAPDDGERKVLQTANGKVYNHTYEVWTGPQPLISQRDFIMKINGDRYSIGPVRMPSNRGNVLQQHFTINAFDEKDIRYKVPKSNPVKFVAIQFQPRGPEFEASSEITDNPVIGDERQLRGRTPVWQNLGS